MQFLKKRGERGREGGRARIGSETCDFENRARKVGRADCSVAIGRARIISERKYLRDIKSPRGKVNSPRPVCSYAEGERERECVLSANENIFAEETGFFLIMPRCREKMRPISPGIRERRGEPRGKVNALVNALRFSRSFVGARAVRSPRRLENINPETNLKKN